MTILDILLIAMFVLGCVAGGAIGWAWRFMRLMGTMLVIQLDRATGFFSMEYRRPSGNDMTITRGKEKGTVPLEVAKVIDPVDAKQWQKRGGSRRMKLLLVDGQTCTPLSAVAPEKSELVFASGWQMRKATESRVVKQFTEDENTNLKMLIMAVLILGVITLGIVGLVAWKLSGNVGGGPAG